MPSNIPLARSLIAECIIKLDRALNYMRRDKPDMVIRDGGSKRLTKSKTKTARAKRKRGLSKRAIARRLGTNSGRVTEALRKKP